LLVVGPTLVLPMVREALASPWLIESYKSSWRAVDLFDLLGPGLGNPGYLALGVAGLGAFAAIRARQQMALFWLLASGLYYVMSLGPFVKIGGYVSEVPMPYSLLSNLPVFDIGRDPGRYTIVATLGVGILASFVLRGLFGQAFL